MSKALIAIDPGLMTGWCVVEYQDDGFSVVETLEIGQWTDVPDRLLDKLVAYEYQVDVVIEKFTINASTHKKSTQPAPLDIIGAVKWLTLRYTGRPAVLQTPADAKSFATNDKLKAVDFWHVGGEGHANDALRHALVYLVRHKNFRDSRLLGDA